MLPPSTMFTLHFLLMWHRPTVLCDIVTFYSIFSGTVCDGVTGTPILCGGRTHQLHSLLRVIETDLCFTHSPHILPQTFISLFADSCRVWKVEPSVETFVTLPGPRFNQPTIQSPIWVAAETILETHVVHAMICITFKKCDLICKWKLCALHIKDNCDLSALAVACHLIVLSSRHWVIFNDSQSNTESHLTPSNSTALVELAWLWDFLRYEVEKGLRVV